MAEVKLRPIEFDAITRIDFATFAERAFAELNPTTPFSDNFHIHLIAAQLEKMRPGDLRRLIVNIPPRNLKSILISVAYVAWLLGHDPTAKIICVSYAQELADALARQCRQIMQSAWYQRVFPNTRLSPSRLAADGFETTMGGFRIATSVEGTLTGLGADYVVIDDPVNALEAVSEAVRNRANQWFRNSLVTRLNDKRLGRIVIVMQRLHEDDLAGHVQHLEAWKVVALSAIAPAAETHIVETPFGTWTHFRKEGEALHPEREPLPVLEGYRRSQGEETFSAQFQQTPVAPGGNMIKADQFQRFDLAAPPNFERIVLSWDTASKATQLSGFSVCTVWGIANKKIYLLDVVRARFEYPDLRARAIALAKGVLHSRKPDTILIEDKASGQSLLQDLKRDGIYNVEAIKPEADKVTRMSAQTALIANGAVFIPKAAPWLSDLLCELMAFPLGRYDDQVDSVSQALKWFATANDEPGILQYYRMMVEQMHSKPGDDQVVTLKCSNHTNVVYPIKADPIYKGDDGLFRMPMRHARPLLQSSGWTRVDET
jgi:predicted phage terminase large subunit-like protein